MTDDTLTAAAETMLSVGGQQRTSTPPGLVKVAPAAQEALSGDKPPELTPAQQAIKERFEQPLTIDWYGLRLTVAPYQKWGFQAQYYASLGDDVGVVTAIFGREQMDQIMASEHATMETIAELLEAIKQYYGAPGK